MKRLGTKDPSQGKYHLRSKPGIPVIAQGLISTNKFGKSFEVKLFGTYSVHKADGSQVNLLFFESTSNPGAASTNIRVIIMGRNQKELVKFNFRECTIKNLGNNLR